MYNNIIPNKPNVIVDNNGKEWPSIKALSREIQIDSTHIGRSIKKNGFYKRNGVKYFLKKSLFKDTISINENQEENVNSEYILNPEDFENYKIYKETKDLPFEKYDIGFKPSIGKNGINYAIALFSDAHIEETVLPASVLGKNEYNLKIAEERISSYFRNLTRCIIKDGVEELIFASLGDTISAFIHEELAQTNGLTPSEATIKAQSLIYCGLEFLCNNTKLNSIKFIGIVGNHSRTTKKIQHSNGYKLSYEWIMYQNIKNMCEINKLPIEFIIPESEMAILDMPDKQRFIFVHGYQIKSGGSGTVCGIYPALNRLAMKWDRTFNQDKIYLGHFHSCVSIPNATVNGSIIGFNSFALSNGFPCEKPAQMYEVFNTERGLILTRQIYCE